MAGPEDLEVTNVSAIIVDPDGRYLMQLRDDLPHVLYPGHWGLFGGGAEPGETPAVGFAREMMEELEYAPAAPRRFTDIYYRSPLDPRRLRRKIFYICEVTGTDLAAMVQHEGADRRLFEMPDLLRQPKTIPSDIFGLLSHYRGGIDGTG